MSSPTDSVTLVLDLMKETFAGAFAAYYDGDPDAIPLFNLPALVVAQDGDETTEGAYGQDDVRDRLTVKVVLNKRDDFDADKVKTLNTTERRIRDLVGRLDPSTHRYEPRSVKGALRSKLLDDVVALAPTVTVEYGVSPRSGGDGFADLTSEGHVSFTLQYAIDTD